MFLEQAFHSKNNFSNYLLGLLFIVVFYFLGQIPLLGYIYYLVFAKGYQPPTTQNEIFAMMDSNWAIFLMLQSFVAVFLIFPFILKKLHHQKLKEIVTAKHSFDFKRFTFSVLIWSAVLIISTTIEYLMSPEDYVWQFDWIPFLILLNVAVIFIPIQAATEEFIFRGYLMQGIAIAFKNKWMPLILTSVLFGILHGANPEVEKLGNISLVYYIGTGLMLGIITLMDDGMELALGFHVANNVLSSLLVTADWSALQTHSMLKDVSEPNAGFQILFPVFVVYPILLVIFANRYQWTHWKEKLTGNIVINYNNGSNEHTNVS